jgi:uncharacterized protein (TIGR02996 family)
MGSTCYPGGMSSDNPFLRRIARRLATDPADEAFLYDILGNLWDDTRRAVYSDWLADRGDPRGEYAHLRRFQALPGITAEEREQADHRCNVLRRQMHPLWPGLVLREGVPGVVTRIEEHAFYVDMGGVEGEVHITEMPW